MIKLFKKYKRYLLLVSLSLFISLLIYGAFIEPEWIKLTHICIKDPTLYNAWGNIKIVQISDLHISRSGHIQEKLLKIIKGIKPDIVCITGDLMQWGDRAGASLDFVNQIPSKYGVYIVLGDADSCFEGKLGCIFCHPYTNLGWFNIVRKYPHFLKNQLVHLVIKGHKITILGVDPLSSLLADPKIIKLIRAQKAPVLVLSHSSLGWNKTCFSHPQLWLCGDTHGGQIRLPTWLWEKLKVKPDPKHMHGLFHKGHAWLYVNAGIGVTPRLPIRIGVRPEVTVITFKK